MPDRFSLLKVLLGDKDPINVDSYMSITTISIEKALCTILDIPQQNIKDSLNLISGIIWSIIIESYPGLSFMFIYYFLSNGRNSCLRAKEIKDKIDLGELLADIFTNYVLYSSIEEKYKLLVLVKDLYIGSSYRNIYLPKSLVIEGIKDLNLEYKVLDQLVESFIIIPKGVNPFHLKGNVINYPEFQWALPCFPLLLTDMSYSRYLLNLYSLCCNG